MNRQPKNCKLMSSVKTSGVFLDQFVFRTISKDLACSSSFSYTPFCNPNVTPDSAGFNAFTCQTLLSKGTLFNIGLKAARYDTSNATRGAMFASKKITSLWLLQSHFKPPFHRSRLVACAWLVPGLCQDTIGSFLACRANSKQPIPGAGTCHP